MQQRLRFIAKPLLYVLCAALFGAFTGLLVKWLSEPQTLQLWIQNGFPFGSDNVSLAIKESITYGIIYTFSLFGTILFSRKIAYRYIPLRSWRGLFIHITSIASIVVIVFLSLQQLDPYICKVMGFPPEDEGETGIVTVVALGATLIITTIYYSIDFYKGMQEAKRTALVSELRALRAQINPHFLFNTLNSIAALVHTRPDEAEYVVEELAELFRYTLRASQSAMVPLVDDLRASERYIAIEQARFRDRMTITRNVDEQALDAAIPSLLIQPLIENAVKHGVSQTEDNCAILLDVSLKGTNVHILVRDTGPGFSSTDPEDVFSKGTGLTNVRDRIRLHFGIHASCTILSDGVELIFPYRPESEKHPEHMPYLSDKYRYL